MSSTLQQLATAVMIGALSLGVAPAAGAADVAPFDIPAILSLTGNGAFVGKAEQDALTRLQGVVNARGGIQGRPLRLVYYDDQTNPQISLQLANDIMARGGAAVLGPSITAQCLSTMPIIQGKLVEYCLSPAIHPDKGSYAFSSNVSTKDLVGAFIRYFHARGLNRIAVINTTDATGQDADRNFAEVLTFPENKGVTIVAQEHLAVTDLTAAAQVAKIKAANPQVLITWGIGTAFATVIRAVKDTGLDVPVATTSANMTFAQMKQYAGFLPKDLYFPGAAYLAGAAASPQQKPALDAFAEANKAAGVTPDFATGTGWDAAVLVIEAFRKLGTGATAAQIHDYLEGLHGFPGITGIYDFRDGSNRGLSEKDVMVMRWDADRTTWTTVSKYGGLPL